jgi:FixJ family two-component response regulator
VPVVFITGQGDIPMAVKAIKSGAVDFLAKPLNQQAVINAVSHALKEDVAVLEANRMVSEVRQRMSLLTPRESEVLHLVIGGLLNKQIALKLGISIKTVKIHRGRAMHKMQAESVAELVRLTQTAGV